MSHNNGWNGRHHTEESKAKNRLAHLGKSHTEETKAKMSKARIGIVYSEETRDKIRLSKLGVKRSEETKAKLRQANLGKTMSEESKVKNRLTHLGKTFTEEHKAKMRGKKSIETRIKMSKAQLGKKHSLGHHHSDEVKAKMSQSKKILWRTPGYKERVIRASMLGRFIHPNKPESILLGLLEQTYPQEWKFVGNGEVVVCGRSPDFINVNGKKSIILMHGIYWHLWKQQKENPELTKEQVEQEDINFYKTYGWDSLIIWDDELKDPSKVLEKVAEFQLRTSIRK